MKKFFFTVTLVVLALAVAFIGYGTYLNATSDSHIETMLAARSAGVNGAVAAYRDIYPELRLGNAGLRAQAQADAIARIEGVLEELYVAQGQEVEQGEPIAKIVNDDVPLAISRAGEDVARAEAVYTQALSTHERNVRLAAEGAIPASELEASASQVAVLKADLDAARIARAQIAQQGGDLTVTAPVSGAVIVVYKQPGNFVAGGTPIAMVADFSKMRFTASVEDAKVRNIAPLEGKFTFHTDPRNVTERAFAGGSGSSFSVDTAFDVVISGVLPPLGDGAPVRSMTFEIDNGSGILEIGMYADIAIRKGASKRALAIPLTAVRDLSAPSVYMSGADSRLVERAVRLGVDDGEFVEVLEGLKEGDVVVTSGADRLGPGMKVEVNMEQ